MLPVSKCLSQGLGLAPVLLKRAAAVELDWDVRQKSRFETTDSLARQLGVFLPRGNVLRGGDVLVAEDGSLIKVIAAPQTLLRITARAQGSPFDLTRAAYHLGNRHVPIELTPGYLQIEPDHVLAELLTAMQLVVHEVQAAFEPEGGAYAAAVHAGPAAHVHAAPPTHVHGPHCNHGAEHAQGDVPAQVQSAPIQIHRHKPHTH
ncbi:MAG: urease accessory protein UreE [Burkholderiaceae bacterium]